MTEELQQEITELQKLGYRVRSKETDYIYNHNKVIGKKIRFRIEKKIMESINP